MNTVYRIEQTLLAKGRKLSASDAIFYGALTLLMHLTLLLATRLLTDRDINAHIPSSLLEGTDIGFYISVATGLLFEAVFFFVGWLFIVGMAVLFDGQSNTRLLFGWLGLCYLPIVFFSGFSFVWLLAGPSGVDYSGLASVSTQGQLYQAIDNTLKTGAYLVMRTGTHIAYALVLILAVETTHRICGLTRIKAAIILGLYVGLLFLLNRLAA